MESKNHLDYFQVLREFRDLSSMAVEHFDEQILPIIKRKQMDLDLMNDNRLRAPITTLCVNQQLFPPGNKDQLAQCNRLLINCQQRSLSLLKTKVMTINLRLLAYT